MGQRTNKKYRNLLGSDQQMQRLEETELRKADRAVDVNYYIFSNISSGTAWLLQGMKLLSVKFTKSLVFPMYSISYRNFPIN